MAAVTAATVAGASALATYLNGKYHITQDLKIINRIRLAKKYYASLGMSLDSGTPFPSP